MAKQKKMVIDCGMGVSIEKYLKKGVVLDKVIDYKIKNPFEKKKRSSK